MSRMRTIGAIALAMVLASDFAFARGGAPSIMGSPGYQRRLQESRQQLAQPVAQPPAVTGRKSRHRHHQ